MKNESPPGCYIESIEIDQLFGETNIQIKAGSSADKRLLIIYGQNGSGKTTILELVRSMLSSDDNAGHRTRICQIPFSRASISLSGGVVVDVKKRDGLLGAYDWSIKKPSQEPLYLHLKPVSGRISSEAWDPSQGQRHNEMLAELQSIIGTVVSLDDKRTFYVADQHPSRIIERRMPDGKIVRVLDQTSTAEDEDDPVYVGLREIVSSVRREALLLSNRGSQGAQSIYTTLINKILSSVHSVSSPVESIEELSRQLIDSEKRSAVLAVYGLTSPVQHEPMLAALAKVEESQREVIANVISPYIESLSARLNAIQSLHDQLYHWIESLNSFFEPKTIKFKVGEEIQIRSKGGRTLQAKDLSSGERHLLLLMTKAFQLRSTGGVMLVDEPELSLNTVWQRGLIHSMLESFGGSRCQLIVASHSLEIAAKYESNLVNITADQ